MPPLSTAEAGLLVGRTHTTYSTRGAGDAAREDPARVIDVDAAPTTTRPDGTVFGTYVNMLKNVIGSGMLAIPFVLSLTGWAQGALLLVGSLAAAVVNVFFIVRSADFARGVGGDGGSYRGMACAAFGPRAAVWADAVVAMYTGGALVVYAVLLTQFLRGPVEAWLATHAADGAATVFGVSVDTAIGVASAAVLVPVCSMRSIESLKPTSTLGNAVLVYTTLLVVVRYLQGGDAVSTRASTTVDVRPVIVSVGTLQALPSVLFAYNCHYNIPVYYSQLEDPSPGKLLGIVAAVYATVTTLYATIGFAGYLTFGDQTKSNIMMNLEPTCAVRLGNLLLGVMIFCTFPVVHFATRNAIMRLRAGAEKVKAEADDETSGGVCDDDVNTASSRRAIAACLVTAAFVIGSVVPSIGVAVAVNGALFGVVQQTLIPAACFFKLSTRFEGAGLWGQRVGAGVNFAVGVGVAVLGLLGTAVNIIGSNTR